ncbi:hypothetical protein Pst134EA_032116 [Puccinia striiformis f. sp. tritici]|uniref:uncharacterized protein n=1 Tax=Puccinia striiformis f. sp. tritici TaxID=168172 RepID=UPI0020076721|nr:uncharacterized protein Pst134EA_032116 [Puccinia striiformis f. sp. tritici]KAH9441889.1 hypothetical protein Pst134EA_032116 [Puccinia striiformis f. sp. tritici]
MPDATLTIRCVFRTVLCASWNPTPSISGVSTSYIQNGYRCRPNTSGKLGNL